MNKQQGNDLLPTDQNYLKRWQYTLLALDKEWFSDIFLFPLGETSTAPSPEIWHSPSVEIPLFLT